MKIEVSSSKQNIFENAKVNYDTKSKLLNSIFSRKTIGKATSTLDFIENLDEDEDEEQFETTFKERTPHQIHQESYLEFLTKMNLTDDNNIKNVRFINHSDDESSLSVKDRIKGTDLNNIKFFEKASIFNNYLNGSFFSKKNINNDLLNTSFNNFKVGSRFIELFQLNVEKSFHKISEIDYSEMFVDEKDKFISFNLLKQFCHELTDVYAVLKGTKDGPVILTTGSKRLKGMSDIRSPETGGVGKFNSFHYLSKVDYWYELLSTNGNIVTLNERFLAISVLWIDIVLVNFWDKIWDKTLQKTLKTFVNGFSFVQMKKVLHEEYKTQFVTHVSNCFEKDGKTMHILLNSIKNEESDFSSHSEKKHYNALDVLTFTNYVSILMNKFVLAKSSDS